MPTGDGLAWGVVLVICMVPLFGCSVSVWGVGVAVQGEVKGPKKHDQTVNACKSL
jgi:hypothetical protein